MATAALHRGNDSADDDDASSAAPASADPCGEEEGMGQLDGGREEDEGGGEVLSLDLEGAAHGSTQEGEGETEEEEGGDEDDRREEEPLEARQLVVTVVTARDVPVRLRAPGDARRRTALIA